MASFNINISAQILPTYSIPQGIPLFGFDDCVLITNSITIALIESIKTSKDLFLLNSYTDVVAYKTLHIRNIVYSNGTQLYLEHNGVKIAVAGAIPYSIDITGLAADTDIPNFVIKMNSLDLVQDESIQFEMAIENINNVVGEYITQNIFVPHNVCKQIPAPKEINAVLILDTTCITKYDVTVFVPPEGSRYVTVSPSDSFGGLATTETITQNKTYSLILDASNVGINSFTSTIILRVYENSNSTLSIDSFQSERDHTGNIC